MRNNIGKRVELHAACDEWIQGDRYGKIVGVGKKVEYLDRFTKMVFQSEPYLIKLDKSGKTKRFHRDNVFII